ncbi:hypothetical protein [Burkholderia gladioli]|uniref:hypothetical protein n=1 Tax=Burkholderia gladioli TaxID=28095 RepID=UPI00064AF966|nr:hypothetical protein [Burkholderia gladioli]MDA0575425.1 hypothetical protein [Burkholderia gladioli]MDA0603659.1 hypothetical protein [Burkholderia gladioli]
MNKLLVSLAAVTLAFASASVFAQDASAPAAKHDKSAPKHKLKKHGSTKGNAKSAAASAAGTNDKGAQQ